MDLAFKALADGHRRAIVDLLAQGAKTVGELLEHFDFTQPALSRHLRILREAGLVSADTDGRCRRYRLERAALGEVATWLVRYRRFWGARLDRLADLLDEERDKT